MLILKELRFKGIGRFVEQQTISIEKFSGHLIQVDGLWDSTGGSSGAAKTTVFNALDFLFALNTIPNTKLQSRLTEDHIFVEADFDSDGLPLTISRGQKLKIELDGVKTTGSSAITEDKLDEILRIPRNLFRQMLHKKQGERGFFLSLSAKQTNDFLTDSIGLSEHKKNLINLDSTILELSKKIGQLAYSIDLSTQSLKSCNETLAALMTGPVKEVDQSTVLKLKAAAGDSSEKHRRMLAVHKSDLAILELNKPVLQTMPFDSTDLDSMELLLKENHSKFNALALAEKDRQNKVQSEIARITAICVELKAKIEKGESAKKESESIALEIKQIRDQKCPTCNGPWTDCTAKDKDHDLVNKVRAHWLTIAAAKEAAIQLTANTDFLAILKEDEAPKTSREAEELKQTIQDLSLSHAQQVQKSKNYAAAQYAGNLVKLDKFNEERKALQAKQEIEARQSAGQADLDRRAFDMAVMKLRSYEEARIKHENLRNTLSATASGNKAQIDKDNQEFTKLVARHTNLEELKRALKNYLSCKFDDALTTISENATKLVRNVPNMANATIRLVGTRETNDGKVKEEVTAVLDLEGDENIDIRTLCGGERSAVDLAVDLSVIDLIETKSNMGINVIILDEPFTGMDSENIEMALEVLKNANPNKKILIVDHNPIVKEAISDRIMVIRNGDISHIEV